MPGLQEEDGEREKAQVLSCNHIVGLDCIKQWIRTRLNDHSSDDNMPKCPFCREVIRADDLSAEDVADVGRDNGNGTVAGFGMSSPFEYGGEGDSGEESDFSAPPDAMRYMVGDYSGGSMGGGANPFQYMDGGADYFYSQGSQGYNVVDVAPPPTRRRGGRSSGRNVFDYQVGGSTANTPYPSGLSAFSYPAGRRGNAPEPFQCQEGGSGSSYANQTYYGRTDSRHYLSSAADPFQYMEGGGAPSHSGYEQPYPEPSRLHPRSRGRRSGHQRTPSYEDEIDPHDPEFGMVAFYNWAAPHVNPEDRGDFFRSQREFDAAWARWQRRVAAIRAARM